VEAELTKLKSEYVEAHERKIFELEARARLKWGLAGGDVFRDIYTAQFNAKDPEGWFLRTYDWYRDNCGLSKSNVQTGVKRLLRAGVIEKKHGVGKRMYFRVLPAAVIEALYPEEEGRQNGGSEVANRNFRSSESQLLKAQNATSHREEEVEGTKKPSTSSSSTTNVSSTTGSPVGLPEEPDSLARDDVDREQGRDESASQG
jgi:hypothetical protein